MNELEVKTGYQIYTEGHCETSQDKKKWVSIESLNARFNDILEDSRIGSEDYYLAWDHLMEDLLGK